MSTYDVKEHFAFPGNIDFAGDDQGAFCSVYSSSVKQSLPSVNHEQFPMQMTEAQQVAPNPGPGRFSTETPLERERRLKIQREQRRRRRQQKTAEQRERLLAQRRQRRQQETEEQRERETEISEALLSFYPVENPHLLVCLLPHRYIDQSLQSFSSVLRPE